MNGFVGRGSTVIMGWTGSRVRSNLLRLRCVLPAGLGQSSVRRALSSSQVHQNVCLIIPSLDKPKHISGFLLFLRNQRFRGSAKNKYYFYDPNEGKWGVLAKAPLVERTCLIENVSYLYREKDWWWYDTKRQEWRVVKGLEVLNRNCCSGAIAQVNYCGKLLNLWDKFEQSSQSENKNIWCTVIALERGNGDDDVWGNVEWG